MKVTVNFEGTTDTTGYLFSLAKCLSAVLRCSRYSGYADDIIASSGFAFRMWAAPDLCPSATSIWEFKQQKPWVECGGLLCDYEERLWEQDAIEEERRLHAIEIIKKSIDDGIAAVAWDISGCEWGIINGYDDNTHTLYTLKINGQEDTIPYEKLGKLELPILSVLSITGKTDKSPEQIFADTKKLAFSHLRGEEWCDNPHGLMAYDTLTECVKSQQPRSKLRGIKLVCAASSGVLTQNHNKYTTDISWNLEYYLGTFAALKWYAWKYFEKYGDAELADIYKTVYKAWQKAFDIKISQDASDEAVRKNIIAALETAKSAESKMLQII